MQRNNFIKIQYPSFFPAEVDTDKPIGGNNDSTEDILNELDADEVVDDEVIDLDDKPKDKKKDNDKNKDDEDDKDDKDDKKKGKDDEEIDEDIEDEDDELSELEDELNEDEDEDKDKDLELLTTRVRRKEILKEFPTLFKKFPELEAAYYREQKFTQLYPTLDDAKQAAESVRILNSFEKDLSNGEIKPILEAAKKANPEAFNKIVDNYLSTLFEIDVKAQHHVIGGIIKNTVIAMVEEANTSENEALKTAANLLHQFVFGTSKFQPHQPLHDPSKIKAKDSPEDEKARKFAEQRFRTTERELSTKVENKLVSTINKYIDPRDSMTEFVKKHATKEALENLNRLVDKDPRFRRILDKLWERAADNDYTEESVAKIQSAYIAKAKTLLPSVIKKARADALKGIGKVKGKTKEKDDTEEIEEKAPREKSGRSASSQSRTDREDKGAKSKDGRGKSTYDYLMED